MDSSIKQQAAQQVAAGTLSQKNQVTKDMTAEQSTQNSKVKGNVASQNVGGPTVGNGAQGTAQKNANQQQQIDTMAASGAAAHLNNGQFSGEQHRRKVDPLLERGTHSNSVEKVLGVDVGSDQLESVSNQMTPYGAGVHMSGGGVATTTGKSINSDGVERRQNNFLGVSHSINSGNQGTSGKVISGTNHVNQHQKPSIKIDGSGQHHLNGSSVVFQNKSWQQTSGAVNGRFQGHSVNRDQARRKRKSSEKIQRRASNVRKNEQGPKDLDQHVGRKELSHGVPNSKTAKQQIPSGNINTDQLMVLSQQHPTNNVVGQGPTSSSLTRSQSRGTNGPTNSQMQPPHTSQLQQQLNGVQNGHQMHGESNHSGDPFHSYSNTHGLSDEEYLQQNSFSNQTNPKNTSISNGSSNLNGQSTQFPSHQNQMQYVGGPQNQAPQVHFIAKKQQFIAQISPKQLLNSEQRSYTEQSNNDLYPSQPGSKKMGPENSVYTKGAQLSSTYHISTAAFKVPGGKAYLGHKNNSRASKTHTSGFSFHPPIGGSAVHKYSNSMFGGGDELMGAVGGKPKIAGKDIVHVMSNSNGFNSVQNCQDPYNSMMMGNGGLPITMVYSNKQSKAKANYNRLQTKEKEQLYDETIKMKVMNNQLKDESVKLKTKIKILENELSRKEKTIEDLFSHNQVIHSQQTQNKSSQQANSSFSFMPLTSTQQKYQQETFLVMSLKKQVRELKFEVLKREEELEVLRKNIRNTKVQELEQEITSYKEECIRQRAIIEDLFKQGSSHPMHPQALTDRINQMQSELQIKDQMLNKMKDQMNQSMKVDLAAYNSNSSIANKSGNTYQGQPNSGIISAAPALGSMSLTALGAQDLNGAKLSSSPSRGDLAQKSQPVVTPQTTTQSFYAQQPSQQQREKSADRKSTGLTYQAQQLNTKELQRDLQKSKKTVRDKEKEIMKLKSEISTLKRENNEKQKSDNMHQKDNESQLKQLREKQRDLRMDLKRKDDKISDVEIKFKRLEDQFREVSQTLKSQEESNKQLKSQLKAVKTSQKVHSKTTEAKSRNMMEITSHSAKDEKKEEKTRETEKDKTTDIATSEIVALKSVPSEPDSLLTKKTIPENVKSELKLVSLMGLREKFSRDELTSMMTSSESGLRMLIRNPSADLISFIKAHLEDEDQIVIAIPKYDIPRAEFETQVLREMRLVLRENQQIIADKCKEQLMKWTEFIHFYQGLQNFEYPHKDKLLDFINYFFLDYIDSAEELFINYQAFKDHITGKRLIVPGQDRTRNSSALQDNKRGTSSDNLSDSAGKSNRRKMLGLSEGSDKAADEEKMHNIAEQCFMRISDLLYQQKKTVKQVLMKYSEPEPFKNGQVLDLIPPRAFITGIKEIGFDDIQELEISALLKVLAKPELEGAIILNEFVHIMESFGIPPFSEEDEFENDYIPDSDTEQEKEVKKDQEKDKSKDESSKKEDDLEQKSKENTNEKEKQPEEPMILAEGVKTLDDNIEKMEALKGEKQDEKKGMPTNSIAEIKKRAAEAAKSSKMKHKINVDFDILDDKGIKILKRLSRFLLERYMHPREFYGPTIKTEIIGKRKNKVEVIKLHDFYLRLKLASIRKKLKEIPSINKCFAIDGDKFPGQIQVKRMIKALELIAEGEQEIMAKEHEIEVKERKEKAEKLAKERAEKGLPPLDLDEDLKKQEEDQIKKKEKPSMLDLGGKDAKGSSESGRGGMLSEVLKLGGASGLGSRSSPSNSREKDGPKYGTAGLGSGPVQLNTIEEDLHETQTSHYSQMVKEGDFTDREGSKHQISTSNYLRNSNAQAEMLEDSARRSLTATGIKTPILDDTNSNMMDGVQTQAPKVSHKALNVRNSLPGCNETSGYNLMDTEEEGDGDLNCNDELVAEVDKKYHKQIASSQNDPDVDQDNYDDDFENDENIKNINPKSDIVVDTTQPQTVHPPQPVGPDSQNPKEKINGQLLNQLENQVIDETELQQDKQTDI